MKRRITLRPAARKRIPDLLSLALLVTFSWLVPATAGATVTQLMPDYSVSTFTTPYTYKAISTHPGYIALSAVPTNLAGGGSTHCTIYPNATLTGGSLGTSTYNNDMNFLVLYRAGASLDYYMEVTNPAPTPVQIAAMLTHDDGVEYTPIDHTAHHAGQQGVTHHFEVYMASLTAYTQYELRVNRQNAGDNVRAAILHAPNNASNVWIPRADADIEVAADNWGVDNPTLFTPSETGLYAVVLFSNDVTVSGDMRVRLQEAPPSMQPDLLVSSITPLLVTSGQPFTVSVQVHNAGLGDAGASTASVSIDGSAQCASIATPAILAGQNATILCSAPALSSGVHTVEACLDVPGVGSVAESDESNNCSSVVITASPPQVARPDLVILSTDPTTVIPGRATTYNIWVKNIGDANAPASQTWVSLAGTETLLATPSLLPGGSALVSTSFTLSQGVHSFTACADSGDAMVEKLETNNCMSQWISAEAPDLQVASITPAEGRDDAGTSLSIAISNTGNATAPPTTTRVTLDGTTICDVATPSIPQSFQVVVNCTTPVKPAGTYTISAEADQPGAVDEISETNNVLSRSLLVRPTKVKVFADGSGDYPTIQAAVDAVAPGGQVSLYSGTYAGLGNVDVTYRGKAATVIAETGEDPIVDCAGAQSAFVFHSGEGNGSVLDGVTIVNLNTTFGGAIRVWNSEPVIQNCMFYDVTADSGSAVTAGGTLAKSPKFNYCTVAGTLTGGSMLHVSGAMTLSVNNTVIASNKNAAAALCTSGGSVSLNCSDVWGNGSDYTGCLSGQNGSNGNIFADPLFCVVGPGGFDVTGDSPCAAANSGACGTIGARDEGCPRAANTFLVKADGTGDYLTIQQALNAAVNGDRILLAPGYFWTPGNFDLTFQGKRVTLEAENGAPGVIIDADSAWGAGYNGMSIIGSPDSVIVRNITIRDASHGAVVGNSKVYFEGVIFTNCSGSGNGAGALVDGAAGPTNVRFVNCYFTSNSVTGTGVAGSEGWGGGLWATGGASVILDGCWVQNNSASQNGGGVFVGGATADYSTGMLTNCQFTMNSAGHNGAGAYAASNVTLDVSNCMFGTNTATDAAGALGYAGTSTGLVTQTVFKWNSAGSDGGAIMTHGWCTPTIEFCTFYQNAAPSGTVYPRHYSNVTLRNSIIVGATSGPAADCVSSSTLNLSFNDFYNNAGGDYVGCAAGQNGVNGNISADPLFCCASCGDFGLHELSPAAGTTPAGRMGARAVSCFATVLHVQADRLGEYQDIQTAIDNARAYGDTVELADGTYTGLGNHDVTFRGKAVVVRSQSGDATTCIVDCQGSPATPYRGFMFNSGETSAAVLENITVRNGYGSGTSGGGAYVLNSSPTLRGCVFENGYAVNGGGVYVQGAPAVIENCSFFSNTTSNSGGGLGLNGSASTVTGCTFAGDSSYAGGGIYANNSPATITACVFNGNKASSMGGGFHARLAGVPVLVGCTFYGNRAPYGGGVFTRNNATPSLTACLVTGGTQGSGVYAQDVFSVPTLTCSDLWGNAGGDWVGQIAGQAGTNGNISADPMYCDAAAGNFGLFAASPAAADTTCGVMGAKPVSCGRTVLVRADGTGDYPTIQAAINAAADADTVDLADGLFTGSGNRDVNFLGKAVVVRSQNGNAAACVVDCQASSGDQHKGFRFDSGEDTTSVLQNVTIRGAYHVYGGGVLCANASPKITGCVFEGNHAYDGGAMHIYIADPVVEDCRFTGNSAEDAGGAISMNTSTAQIRGCTFENNVADYGGGGTFMYSASPSIQYCVYNGNSAYQWGGAVHAKQSSTPTIRACTMYGSHSINGGGLYSEGSSTPALERVIIASGTAGAGAVAADGSSVPAFSCSDIWGNPGGDWTGFISGQLGAAGNVSADPVFCAPTYGNFDLGASSPCLAANNTCGVVMGYTGAVCTPTGVGDIPQLPQSTALLPNYPNPFNPATVIPYELAQPSSVRIVVYDVAGRRVATLVDRDQPAGRYRARWDGRTRSGRAASGVYFYRMTAGRIVQTRKMVLLK